MAAAAVPGAPALSSARVTGLSHGRLRVEVRTNAPLDAAHLGAAPGQSLCLAFWAGDGSLPRSRVCLEGDALVSSRGALPATITHPDPSSFAALLPRSSLGLPSVFYFQAQYLWTSPPCAQPCVTTLPAIGKRTVDLRPRGNSLAAQFAPRRIPDSRDAAGSPLDVREVTFAQRDTQLELNITTESSWSAASLDASGRSLCVVVNATGRLCVAPSGGLRYGGAAVAAVVSRPNARTVRAFLAPAALGLPLGDFHWQVESSWKDAAACAAGCADVVPDEGAFAGTVEVLAQPRCFGAAARDPRDPHCSNPVLSRRVYPSPELAAISPSSPCETIPTPPGARVLRPCEFGTPAGPGVGTVALIGDSHARMWRAAIDVVARYERWRGLSVVRPGCPFSTQVPASPALGPSACRELHAETLRWLAAHPEIDTVFVSDWAEPPSGPQGGLGGYGGGPAGFAAMLRALPPSVKRIYVIRDAPGASFSTPACVRRALAHRRSPGAACAIARAAALTPDPGYSAALELRGRVRPVDLTRYFCSRRECFPVVGGAYVYKDDNHINSVFATSLGPFLLRAIS